MAIYITPLLELDPSAEPMGTDDIVDLVRLNVRATATTEGQAIEVLTLLGRPLPDAWHHVHYCVTGEWL